MIHLDSPRWNDLSHAFGPASDVPALLRRLRAERERPSTGSAWGEVYGSLCHQYSLYSATYAAFPHLVDIAASGTPYQRLEVLLLAGAAAVHGHPPEVVPSDLEGELEAFFDAVRAWSLACLEECDAKEPDLQYMLQAIGGLRAPKSPAAYAIERLQEGESEVVCECSMCREAVAVWMREPGPHGLAFDANGGTIENFTRQRTVDRSAYPDRLRRGESLLREPSVPDWPEEHVSEVLAALANRLGAARLATQLLDLAAEVECPYCGATWPVEPSIDCG